MVTSEANTLTPLVAEVLEIVSVEYGDPKKGYWMRYQGRLRCDSVAAYDQLAAHLRPLDITPLFRNENGQHTVLLMQGTLNPRPSNPWVNVVMLGLTIFSVFYVGSAYVFAGPVNNLTELFLGPLLTIYRGWPFAVSLMGILLAHEFGHYLMGRHHHTMVTLPYFIPMPIPGSFGTMGAVIQMKEPPKNRRILLDIGIAGPLAGLVVAIPVLLIGLSLSNLDRLTLLPGQVGILEGNSLLYLLLKYITFGKLLPAPVNFGSLPPFFYWLRYFFTGQPLPAGGIDVTLNPVAWAGWAGLLVTSLNLIPAGQLDGGHMLYVLAGRQARRLLPFILGGLVLLGFVWPGWWLWAFLILMLGRLYAEPLDQITPLDKRRKLLALLGLFIFIIVFTPVPLIQYGA